METTNNSRNYYYVSQSSHGHEYVWIFDDEGLKSCPIYEGIKSLPFDDSTCEDILWPIGGSNSSSTYFMKLRDKEEAMKMLLAAPDGPDLEDPCLSDIAEYIRTISTGYGSCTQEFIDEFNIKDEVINQYDGRYQELIGLGVKPDEFYEKRKYERYSDVKEELEMKTYSALKRKLYEMLKKEGFSNRVVHSFEEAKTSWSRQNIILLDDGIYITYRAVLPDRSGETLGEFVCWVEDEFNEDETLYQTAVNAVKELFSYTYPELDQHIKDDDLFVSFKPYDDTKIV